MTVLPLVAVAPDFFTGGSSAFETVHNVKRGFRIHHSKDEGSRRSAAKRG